MPWPTHRLPPPDPPATLTWERRDDPRILGPRTLVAVFAGSAAPTAAPPMVAAPALRQRIEYARLFEDGRAAAAPVPAKGAAHRHAVGRYALAVRGQ